MALPPLELGANHSTYAEESLEDATTLLGWLGTVAGVTGDDELDSALSPTELTAFTVKV